MKQPARFQASSISRYSAMRFCFFFTSARLSGLMFSSPMNTRRTPARPAFSMKLAMRWPRVSTWMTNLNLKLLARAMAISRSKIASQLRLRAKLSSVMKKLRTPWARLARTIASTSSAERRRDLRPWTLMMVQKLHWNGQPRPASNEVTPPVVPATISAGSSGNGAPSSAGRSLRKLYKGLSRPEKASWSSSPKRPSTSPA